MSGRRKVEANYEFFSWFAYYIPNVKGIFWLIVLLLLGSLLGNVVTMLFGVFMGQDAAMEYGTLVAYPLMFLPAMMYARGKSSYGSVFDPGVELDSSNFGKAGGLVLGLLVIVATLAAGFMTDVFNVLMPDMPEWLEKALDSMTGGNFILNFICVSLFAPLFEEWLCRGMVLRGLLNYERTLSDGTKTRGIRPSYAIVISALFFAVIHANPWQAVPAFLLGLLFGYVYYRTGSLKLTMLMHFTNNTFSLLLAQNDKLAEMNTWFDLMPPRTYAVLFVIFGAFIFWFINFLEKIELKYPQGNCNQILPEK